MRDRGKASVPDTETIYPAAPVPPESVTLAAEALNRLHADRGWHVPAHWWAQEAATAMTAAAAPGIIAAERKRISGAVEALRAGARHFAANAEMPAAAGYHAQDEALSAVLRIIGGEA